MNNSGAAPETPPSSLRLSVGVTGLAILVLVVAFTGFWMAREGRILQQPVQFQASFTGVLPGFRNDVFYLPDDGLLGFTEIPEGQFLMGSNPAQDRLAYENERWSASQLQGSVYLEGFYMSRYEVTVAQFKNHLAAAGINPERAAYGNEPDHPVVNVTWAEALNYAHWLQQQLLVNPSTPGSLRDLLEAGWRLSLPSEAQWEKAARGPDGRIFPWGNESSRDFANFSTASLRPVGSYSCPDCSHGLSDMSGNAWEMTRSPYRDYPFTDAMSVIDLGVDALWVMRGGSYADSEGNVRTAVRGGVDPGVRNPGIGFRLALLAPVN